MSLQTESKSFSLESMGVSGVSAHLIQPNENKETSQSLNESYRC